MIRPRAWHVLLLVLTPLACTRPTPPAAPAASVTVHVVPLAESELPRLLSAVGTVRPRTWVPISSRIPQTILQIAVREGDRVERGRLLVALDDQQLRAQERAAAAEAAAAADGVRQAEAGLVLANAEAELAATTFERYRRLHDKHAVSEQEFDQARARHQVGQAALAQARAGLETARNRELQARSGLEAAAAAAGYAQISAPISGTVLTRELDPGALAVPGQPILTLGGSDGWRVDAALDAARLAQVRVGQACRISTEGAAGLAGRIERIVAAADPESRTVTIQIRVPDHPSWRAGAIARVELELPGGPGLRIPAAARRLDGQLETAFVVDAQGRARQRLIRTRPLPGGDFEVLSGLRAGERLILKPLDRLLDGQAVTVEP